MTQNQLQEESRNIVSRWGDPTLDDRYYVRLPGWILFNLRWFVDVGWTVEKTADDTYSVEPSPTQGQTVGFTASERSFLSTVMVFKFDSPNTRGAKPSIGLLAHIEGLTMRAIQSRKKTLVDKGALSLEFDHPRRNTDTYDFSEVVRQCRIYHDFWVEHGLENPVLYKEREEFIASGEGEKLFRVLQGEKIFRVGGEKNFTQRIRNLKNEKSDDTIKIVSSANLHSPNLTSENITVETQGETEDEILGDEPRVQQSEGADNNSDKMDDNSATNGEKKITVPKVKLSGKPGKTPKLPQIFPKSIAPSPDENGKPSKPKKKDKKDDGRVRSNQITEAWLRALLTCFGKEGQFKGFVETDDIKHSRKIFGRALSAVGIIRSLYEDHVKQHPEIDYSDLTPDKIMADYFGTHKVRNGWLFRHKLPEGTESFISEQGVANHFGDYLVSGKSLVGRRIVQEQQHVKVDIPAEQMTDPQFGTEDEYKQFLAMREAARAKKQKQENNDGEGNKDED